MRRLLLAAALLFVGCVPPAPQSPVAPAPEADDALELITYDVAPEALPKAQAIVGRLLRSGGDSGPVGRYAEAPGGKLAVLAPADVHAGMKSLLAHVSAGAESAPPVRNLRFTYYVVGGTPATGETGPPAAELTALSDTLSAIQGWDGPQWFRLVGHTTLTNLDGEMARSSSSRLSVRQVASIDAATDRIHADIDLSLESAGHDPSLDTRVQLQPGQTLILSTLDGGGELPPHLYTIVRADVLPTE